MQCVEFETRLNGLLDERLSPSIDTPLIEHAQDCPGCFELLAAHEALLEGVQALPTVRLCDAERQALTHRVIVEVGSLPLEPFPAAPQVELAERGTAAVATNGVAPLALIGLVLATAAAVLIAVLPWLPEDRQPPAPPGQPQSFVETEKPQRIESPGPAVVLKDYEDLEPIAWVGYQVADGLTPVTNSMVSALRELRKRPFFRNADQQGRSSFYSPRENDVMVA